MRIFKRFIFLLLSLSAYVYAEEYAFQGNHFLASYCECDVAALTNLDLLEEAMHSAVKESGATILGSVAHRFEGDGYTLAILLSESHATIHTYPEHRACFIDLFTCGNHCDAARFHDTLCSYLKPAKVSSKLVLRNQATVDQP